MYRDRCLVVEGHFLLPVGVVFVPLPVQDWCWFGLVCPVEVRFLKPQEVCTLAVWPGHGMRCGGLGGVIDDRGLRRC